MSHSEKRSRPRPHETLQCRDPGRNRPSRRLPARQGQAQAAEGRGEGGELRNIPCHASAALSCPRHPALVGAFEAWRMRTCLERASWGGLEARNNDFIGNP